MVDRRATLEIFRCEHGHDVMKLCRQFAGNSVTLYTVAVAAISKPVPSYVPDPALALTADFFTGISLSTGGQFIQIQNIKLISEVKKCLCYTKFRREVFIHVPPNNPNRSYSNLALTQSDIYFPWICFLHLL